MRRTIFASSRARRYRLSARMPILVTVLVSKHLPVSNPGILLVELTSAPRRMPVMVFCLAAALAVSMEQALEAATQAKPRPKASSSSSRLTLSKARATTARSRRASRARARAAANAKARARGQGTAFQVRRNRRAGPRHPRRSRHHLRPAHRPGAVGAELAGRALHCQHHQGDDGGGRAGESGRPRHAGRDPALRRLSRAHHLHPCRRSRDEGRPAAPAADRFRQRRGACARADVVAWAPKASSGG